MSTQHVANSSLQYVAMTSEERIRIAQGKRLMQMRKAAGFKSGRAAAIAGGWAESTYRSHENGSRTIDPMDAARYSLFFLQRGAKGENFTGRWIIYGDEEDLTPADFEDLLRGETIAFKNRAYEAILNLKKR